MGGITKQLSLAPLLALLSLGLACSSSPVPAEDLDPTADEPEPEPETETGADGSGSASRECTQCMTSVCSAKYQLCLPKDPNGCANLGLCIARCSVASCMYECGGNWAISPEANDYYSCVSSGCAECFPDAEPSVGKACQECLLSCRGLPECCAGNGCLCEESC